MSSDLEEEQRKLNAAEGALIDAGIVVKDERFDLAIHQLHRQRDELRSALCSARHALKFTHNDELIREIDEAIAGATRD